jgi:hypothetical protein
MRFPNVNGISLKLQDELIDGKPSGRKAIRVYVVKKVPREMLAFHELLPDEIEGVPVDVIEIGKVKALGVGSGKMLLKEVSRRNTAAYLEEAIRSE